MRILFFSMIIAASSSIAIADEFNEELTAINFSTILAAEEACGFSYDPAAIKKYIAETVPASVISFPATLTRWTRMQKSYISDMATSEKNAYCASVEHTAKTHNFIK